MCHICDQNKMVFDMYYDEHRRHSSGVFAAATVAVAVAVAVASTVNLIACTADLVRR